VVIFFATIGAQLNLRYVYKVT